MPPMRSDDAVEQVRSRLNLVDVVRQHVRLRKQGREWVGLCPFHQEKTPSLSVNEQKQSWYCFGCQRSGDVFTFVELIEKLDFRGALEVLAEQAGVELAERSPGEHRRSELRRRLVELNRIATHYYEYVLWNLPAGEPGRALLARREVGEETSRRFGLGYAPGGGSFCSYLARKGRSLADAVEAGLVRQRDRQDFFQQRLVVPIRDERGQPVAFTGRTVLVDEVRKYVNTRDTAAYHKGRVLFALDLARPAIDERGHAVLMEGQFDVIVAHQFGVGNAVASSGTALTEDQVRLLKRYSDELVLCFDNDGPGRRAVAAAVTVAEGLGVRTRVARIEGEAKDPDDMLRAGGDWQRTVANALPGWEYRLRASIDGLNPARPNDLARAIGRVGQVLAEIADPAVQEEYRLLAAKILAVDEHRLRVPAQGGPGARGGAGSAGPPAEGDGRPTGSVDEHRLSSPVARLLQVLAVFPDQLETVRSALDPGDLEADDRQAYLRLSDAVADGGVEGLAQSVGAFPDEEAQLVREAWASPPKRFAAEEAAELVSRLRDEARHREFSAIIGRLLEAERRGDRAAAEALNREVKAFRERG